MRKAVREIRNFVRTEYWSMVEVKKGSLENNQKNKTHFREIPNHDIFFNIYFRIQKFREFNFYHELEIERSRVGIST